MTNITHALLPFAILAALGLPPAPAQAQLARTFVSSVGNDANDCGRLTPCRTFQRAHDNTLANGEITVLDPGGYGAVTITKTISIINDGVGEAGVLVSGGLTGITITAGASDAVGLRGLTVKGIGFGGGTGIQFNSGKSLTIESCAIRNLTGNGIEFVANGSSSLAVSNTFVADNGLTGIFVGHVAAGTVKAVVNRVEAHNNGASGIVVSGLGGGGVINAAVADSIASNNGGVGFAAASSAGGALSSLLVIRSVAANNGTGLVANSANAILRVGQSSLIGNTTSWSELNSGAVRSYGDNNIDGNGDGNPAPLPITKK
jgi:hypothetical protein